MTLEDLLGNSKLTPEEVAENMEYKSIKNYITENVRDANRMLMDNVMRIVKGLAEDTLYSDVSGYCCSCDNKIEIPAEDKKMLLIAIYKKAKKNLDKMEKKVSGLEDTFEDSEDKESLPEKVQEIPAPIVQAITQSAVPAATSGDMFGY